MTQELSNKLRELTQAKDDRNRDEFVRLHGEVSTLIASGASGGRNITLLSVEDFDAWLLLPEEG